MGGRIDRGVSLAERAIGEQVIGERLIGERSNLGRGDWGVIEINKTVRNE